MIFCGKGNNGGDGFAAARYLHSGGLDVVIFLPGGAEGLKPDARQNYQKALNLGIPVKDSAGGVLDAADFAVDALFGTGLGRPLADPYLNAVAELNRFRKPVYALDIPSGLNSDTGWVCGAAVKASVTLTLGLPKTGLYLAEGPRLAGEIVVLDIGIPESLIELAE